MTDSLILRGLCPLTPTGPFFANILTSFGANSPTANIAKGSGLQKLEKALKIMAFEVLKSLRGSELARRFPKAS
jgi:hypothetical protein